MYKRIYFKDLEQFNKKMPEKFFSGTFHVLNQMYHVDSGTFKFLSMLWQWRWDQISRTQPAIKQQA